MRPRLLDLFSCQGGAAVGYARAGFEVVGIDWMDRRGLSQSIPPAYTEYIGTQLYAALADELGVGA